MNYLYLIVLTSLPLFAYAGSYAKTVETKALSPIAHVSVIELYDDITLSMDGNAAPSQIHNPAVTVEVKNGVMSLRATKDKQYRHSERTLHLNAKDNFKHLSEIRLFNRSNLLASHMKAPAVLRHKSSGQVVVKGYVPLVLFEQTGRGTSNLSFIDSAEADIQIHQGTASLSGVVKRLRYFATGDAVVDAKALRADIMWVNAKGSSVSFLMPVVQSHTVASDKAQVLLTNKTPYFSTLSSRSGEILYNSMFALAP